MQIPFGRPVLPLLKITKAVSLMSSTGTGWKVLSSGFSSRNSENGMYLVVDPKTTMVAFTPAASKASSTSFTPCGTANTILGVSTFRR